MMNFMRKYNFIFIVIVFSVAGWLIYSRATAVSNQFLLKFQQANIEKIVQESVRPELLKPGAVRAPILVYHAVRSAQASDTDYIKQFSVVPDVLDRELKYLKDNGYTTITFNQLADHFATNAPLPLRPVIITFDDGWQNQYRNAFPLLKKYGFTATFFVFTNAINHLGFLTWDQIKDLDKNGMTIGGHTSSHPYLYQITDPNVLKYEIIDSKKLLETNLGHPVDNFAYPFGYYKDATVKFVREAGFRTARSAFKGLYHNKDDLFTLRGVLATSDYNKFVQELNK